MTMDLALTEARERLIARAKKDGLVSVGYDGRLYDCDFNQMLELGLDEGQPADIFGFDRARLSGRLVRTGEHCFGCTAGAGSSCGGALA